MQIPSAQLAVLNERFLDEYTADTVGYLTARYQDWAAARPAAGIEAFIRSGIRKAGRYNLDSRRAVTAFLEYQVRLGPDFDKDPAHRWASDILRIRNLHGSQKLARLLQLHPL